MLIFEICGSICCSFILAYFAARDNKDIFWLTKTFEFFTVRNIWQNLADLPNENRSGEI